MTTGADGYWSNLGIPREEEGAAESFLVRQFRSFYAELARRKRQVKRGTYVSVSESGGDQEASPSTAADLQEQFVSMFNTQEQAVRRRGGESLRQRYELIQYAMVALTDEVFLNVEWSGRDYWYDHLLESRQFDSQNAGVRVFDIIDRLLQEQSSEVEVATVYLYILTLGFEGQYRDTQDASALADYRKRLHQYVKRRDPQKLDPSRPLSSSAYRHTLDRGETQLLPNLRWWVGSLIATGVLYLVVSTTLWWWYTDDLPDLAREVLRIP
ncbi:MAG: DotU family type IV/VI secretion system protein [Candidatus Bipolaricaulia bacterium]